MKRKIALIFALIQMIICSACTNSQSTKGQLLNVSYGGYNKIIADGEYTSAYLKNQNGAEVVKDSSTTLLLVFNVKNYKNNNDFWKISYDKNKISLINTTIEAIEIKNNEYAQQVIAKYYVKFLEEGKLPFSISVNKRIYVIDFNSTSFNENSNAFYTNTTTKTNVTDFGIEGLYFTNWLYELDVSYGFTIDQVENYTAGNDGTFFCLSYYIYHHKCLKEPPVTKISINSHRIDIVTFMKLNDENNMIEIPTIEDSIDITESIYIISDESVCLPHGLHDEWMKNNKLVYYSFIFI